MNDSQNIILKYHEYLKTLFPVIEKFPRSYRFLLGDRILVLSFDTLEKIIEAYYQKEKIHSLIQANLYIEKTRNFLRIAVELKLLSFKQTERLLSMLEETGRMLGGWLKKEKSKYENL